MDRFQEGDAGDENEFFFEARAGPNGFHRWPANGEEVLAENLPTPWNLPNIPADIRVLYEGASGSPQGPAPVSLGAKSTEVDFFGGDDVAQVTDTFSVPVGCQGPNGQHGVGHWDPFVDCCDYQTTHHVQIEYWVVTSSEIF